MEMILAFFYFNKKIKSVVSVVLFAFKCIGVKIEFYLICGRTDASLDGDYEMEHPAMQSLLGQIHARVHEIGAHLSYNTYRDVSQIKARQSAGGGCVRRMSQAKWGGANALFALGASKDICSAASGNFTILWHNSNFSTARSVNCAKEFLAVNFDQALEA